MPSNSSPSYAPQTGNFQGSSYGASSPSVRDRVELWYIKPLKEMSGNNGFICLMVCLPLLEVLMRYDCRIDEDRDVDTGETSPEMQACSRFLGCSKAEARTFWDGFRNGMLHRGMPKNETLYRIEGSNRNSDKAVTVEDGMLVVYVWTLRDKVVEKLENTHRNLWNKTGCDLAKIMSLPGSL